jgi:hypothetical protein
MVVAVAVPDSAGTRWPWSVVSWLVVATVAIVVAARAMGPVHGAFTPLAFVVRRRPRTEP